LRSDAAAAQAPGGRDPGKDAPGIANPAGEAWGSREGQPQLRCQGSVEGSFGDVTALDQEVIHRDTGKRGEDAGLVQHLRRIAVVGRKSGFDRQRAAACC
jgi:hypothetical protein